MRLFFVFKVSANCTHDKVNRARVHALSYRHDGRYIADLTSSGYFIMGFLLEMLTSERITTVSFIVLHPYCNAAFIKPHPCPLLVVELTPSKLRYYAAVQ